MSFTASKQGAVSINVFSHQGQQPAIVQQQDGQLLLAIASSAQAIAGKKGTRSEKPILRARRTDVQLALENVRD